MRTLYDCQEARYPVPPEEYVRCRKGHMLGSGWLSPHRRQVDREDRLALKVCQTCPDFNEFDTMFVREGK